MPSKPSVPFLVLLTLQLTFAFPAPSEEALDLSVEPSDVERPGPRSLLDLGDAAPRRIESGPGEPGWSVRPEVELDLGPASDEESGLRSLNPDLESLGLRLKRTW